MGIDYLLKDGYVVDGSGKGAGPERADIAFENDRIKAVGDLADVRADKTISIKGLVACPGFIDTHSHSEFTLLADGRAEGKICQGITTEINGNCGMSAAPLYGPALEQREKDLADLDIKDRWNTFEEYFALLEKKGFSVNFATLAGHGNLRASAAGYSDRQISDAETGRINALLKDAMDAGARGISTGLIYPPGVFSQTDELISLARETAKHKGIYATHMRSEGDRLVESVEEVIRIADGSGIHAHISHMKASGEKNWNKLNEVFEKIDSAHERGLSLTCDRYPYIAASTDLDAVLPSWAFEGGRKKEIERLKTEQERLAADIIKEHPEASSSSFWDTIIVSSVHMDRNKWMEGESISAISGKMNKPPMKCLFNLLIEEDLAVGAIFFSMNEENLRSVLRRTYTVIGTDSSARSFEGITAQGRPHPRGFGSFPRVLGMYVREHKVLTLSEAVYKMTGQAASIFSLEGRGVIREGNFADITVFDPDRVNDTADYKDPFRRPEGIHHVFVNGTPVVLDGEVTGALPGRVLK